MPDALIQRILSADSRAIARAATLIENRAQGTFALLQALFAHTGRALVVGITGSPGAGKSTLTSALVREWRGQSKRVAVIAVDPSSPFSGGAILGDRIRMDQYHGDEGVFIRSTANRGHLGGLAATTGDLAVLFDAAGFDIVLIETVGAGQDEVEIATVAHLTCVVLSPGQGDDVQAIKAGMIEIADLLVVNKCDLEGAARLERNMRAALLLAPSDAKLPEMVRTTASRGEGVAQLAAAIQRFSAGGNVSRRAPRIWESRLRQMYAARVVESLDSEVVRDAAASVAGGKADPYTIMEVWLERLGPKTKEWKS